MNLDRWFKSNVPVLKNIFKLDWSDKSDPVAIFTNEKPNEYDLKKKINWKIGKRKYELFIYGILPQDEIIPKNEDLIRYNIPFLKSHLQKCVRRNIIQAGLNTLYSLFHLDYNEFIRRLPIIILEDSLLIEKFPVLIWLLVANPEYKISYKYQLDWLINQIYHIIKSPYKDLRDKLEIDFNNYLSEINQLQDNQVSILYSIELRKSYGGMNSDIKMLNYFIDKWLKRFKNNNNIYLQIPKVIYSQDDKLIEVIPLNYTQLNFSEIELVAIDFHCFPQILTKIMNNVNINDIKNNSIKMDKEIIKKLIWKNSAGINLKSNISDEENNLDNLENNTDNFENDTELNEYWLYIKDEYEKIQNYYFQNRIISF